MQQQTIGLFGFGVVGQGLYKILNQTPTLKASIKRIVIKHAHKERNAPYEIFTQLADEVLNDKEVNTIVELIDDAEAAFYIVSEALKKGKAVVSANKKMIAENFQQLLLLQKQYNVPFLYEAAVCGSIPIIRNLEEYYDNDLLKSIEGIVNGSTNYILTKMATDDLSFEEALQQAQLKGFAESNPTLDIQGIDAANKLIILLTHAYGIVTKSSNIVYTGIQNISKQDALFAIKNNYTIKLVAKAVKLNNNKIAACLLPQFVQEDSQLYNVANEYNGVALESSFAEQQFFYGKGAGSFPTASAVLSDISALRYNYKYEYRKKEHQLYQLTNNFYLRVYVSSKNKVLTNKFVHIEKNNNNYIIGYLPAHELLQNSWWKQNDTSLILMPDGIVEEIKEDLITAAEKTTETA
jgi:homoserine dehydrogenase